VCGIEGCATDALLELEGLLDGDLWVPLCRFCFSYYFLNYGSDSLRFRYQPAPTERRVEMRLKESFVETLAKAVAAEIDADDLREEVVKELSRDVDTRDIEEKIVEAIVDDINTSNVEDKAFAKIVKDILDDIQENDEFLDKIVQAVAQKVLALITEREEEPEVEEGISPPRVETAEDTTGGPGAVACRDCGGSLFLHRDETCPTYKREEIPY
jgi:hypothetical protein